MAWIFVVLEFNTEVKSPVINQEVKYILLLELKN
jgi:hypothetical protein